MASHEVEKKDICRTNLSQPGGLVKVLDIVWDTNYKRYMCFIEHVEDHPYGYPKGDKGWYALDDLIYIRAENIHDRLRARTLKHDEYKTYLSRYRNIDRVGYWSSGFEEWPYEDCFVRDGMSAHGFDIRDHVRLIKRAPEWMRYEPVSEAYSEYHIDRMTGYGADMEEARIEKLAEEWKFEQGW